MREYVAIKTIRENGLLLPSAILFRNQHYPISEILRSSFFQGETTFIIRIGKQVTHLYRDDFANRWFVVAA
ncbi:MAG: hypothetical protein IJ719_04755 [Clostridia bacterium]|nr:hypothetical protein [Clostridia bacterium]